ncbi:Protein GrpE [bioreactor metagenome]|uniref:Protein GrpE n=1 Tax=bioreactor metagenome TaxID=1076179 RepID=A0A645BZ81_9ZZZZ
MTEKNQQEQEQDLKQSVSADDNVGETGLSDKEVSFDSKEVDKILASIEEKNRLLDESAERLKRLQADFDNFRRRTRQEKEELSNIVAQAIILELLPVLDNFERAIAAGETQEVTGIKSGVEMIYRQLTGALEKNGLAPIQAVGEIFNPERHEAVMKVEDSEKEDGTIIEEFQKGYIVRGRVIRPSMVKVAAN